MHFSTKFLTYNDENCSGIRSVHNQSTSNTEISTLDHHLPVINQCLLHTPQNTAFPGVSNNRRVPSLQMTPNSSSRLRTKLQMGYQPYKQTG